MPLKERFQYTPCGAYFCAVLQCEFSRFVVNSSRSYANCVVVKSSFRSVLYISPVGAHPTAGRDELARLRYCVQHGAQLLGMAERLVRVFRTVRVVQGEHLRPTYREGGKGSKEKLREAAS